MSGTLRSVAAGLLLAIVIAACSSASTSSSGGASFPADPYAIVKTTSGRLTIDVRTAPDQPPSPGTSSVELRVRDGSGASVDGLTLVVVPWMPAHAHGASVQPTVFAEGDGRYLVTNVSFYMPGSWQLRITIQGAVNDDATANIEVA